MNVEIKVPSLAPMSEDIPLEVRLNLQNIHATLEEIQRVLYKIAESIEGLS